MDWDHMIFGCCEPKQPVREIFEWSRVMGFDETWALFAVLDEYRQAEPARFKVFLRENA